jgi:hypothetical protein
MGKPMTRYFWCILGATVGAIAGLTALAAPLPKTDSIYYVDLKDHINVKLNENLHSNNYENNNLNSLKTGKQTLLEVPFEIGKGVLQLGSKSVEGKPKKFEGIKVGKEAKKLHFLHATGYSAENNTVIGKYIIHYDDKTTKEIEIVFGKDVVDWWAYPDREGPTEGKVAWESENDASKGFNAKIRLYLKTWENPKPDQKIVSIDFVVENEEQAPAPFCVAITAIGKEKGNEKEKEKEK